MAFTQSDLTSIETAIAKSERRVKYESGEVEYRTLAELEQARRKIQAELNSGTSLEHTYPRHQLADFSDD